MEKKSDFDRGIIVGAREGALRISETAGISWDFHAQQFLELAENAVKNVA